jgi:hypothetical protein
VNNTSAFEHFGLQAQIRGIPVRPADRSHHG